MNMTLPIWVQVNFIGAISITGLLLALYPNGPLEYQVCESTEFVCLYHHEFSVPQTEPSNLQGLKKYLLN